MDDWQLLNEYATRNSEEAFRALVERYSPMVYHAALRQVRNSHIAEEVTQAVFIALAQKAGRLPKGTILYGWLFRAARYALLNLMRDEACRRRHEQEATTMEMNVETGDADSVWEQISPHLDDALERLPQVDREVVMIRYFGNKSHREIAQTLGVSEDTAKKRLSRAMEKLRGIFARRGVTVSSVALAAALTAHGANAAPAGLAISAASAALAKGASGSASTAAMAKGILRLMAWAKAKFAVAIGAGVLLAAAGTSTMINSGSASAKDVVAQLGKQSGKIIVADKHLEIPATLDFKNVPVEKALDQLVVAVNAYWTVDYAVYDSDQSLRRLLDLLREGSELQTGGWTNLTSRMLHANISVQSFDPHGRSRAFMRQGPPPDDRPKDNVSMIVVMGPDASFGPPKEMSGGFHLRGPGDGPEPGGPFQLVRDAMQNGVTEGVLAPERLLGQTELISKITLPASLVADEKTAAQIAKAIHGRWVKIYTLRKSPVPNAGIKLVHAGMENSYGPTNMTFGNGEAMKNMMGNRFNLTPEDRAAHDRAVQAFKNQK